MAGRDGTGAGDESVAASSSARINASALLLELCKDPAAAPGLAAAEAEGGLGVPAALAALAAGRCVAGRVRASSLTLCVFPGSVRTPRCSTPHAWCRGLLRSLCSHDARARAACRLCAAFSGHIKPTRRPLCPTCHAMLSRCARRRHRLPPPPPGSSPSAGDTLSAGVELLYPVPAVVRGNALLSLLALARMGPAMQVRACVRDRLTD